MSICITSGYLTHTQRKFVRSHKPSKDKLHEQFRGWLDANPSVDLEQVVVEDQAYDYAGTNPGFTDSTGSNLMLPQFTYDE